MKFHVLYDKSVTIVQSYTGKNITHLLPLTLLLVLSTRNYTITTNSSSIALYYSDTYIYSIALQMYTYSGELRFSPSVVRSLCV